MINETNGKYAYAGTGSGIDSEFLEYGGSNWLSRIFRRSGWL